MVIQYVFTQGAETFSFSTDFFLARFNIISLCLNFCVLYRKLEIMIIMKSLSQTNLPLFLKESTLRTLQITQICRPKTVSLHQVKFVYGVLASWLWEDVK